ncbi:hypothetical protein QKU48_gp0029 [Fadolivirus algeromassiliense]|jgi:hypothetical protein|uniref:Uncharacterized protein n=1 Tax=Fadolivirus FV1/VV64 TaxID=3070911 RepID=A0A7D3QTN9_9VIRU|nr:hypothetical protein QKU48_gp0029 [Fadolivirus algeromassiliense]QKF93487.1 hypothetical protein Fadolivirus_1_29 [Fadolivirus FV1/VV64]
MIIPITLFVLFIITFIALYYNYNGTKEHFDHFEYAYRMDFPQFVVKRDSKPIVHKNIYLKLENNTDGNTYYFRFNKYGYCDIEKKLLYRISLSTTKDIRNKFDLHINDPNNLVPCYIKFNRNNTIDDTYLDRHRLANKIFVTSLYNPNYEDFIELNKNNDGTYSLLTRIRTNCGEYSFIRINDNKLTFDQYDKEFKEKNELAKFLLVDQNDKILRFRQ